MTGRPLTFTGFEKAYIIAALCGHIAQTIDRNDLDELDHLLERAVSSMDHPLAPDVAARIQRFRKAKGLA